MLVSARGEAGFGYAPYADFPRSEYTRRVDRVRELMESSNVDLLVLWDAANIRYFCGFRSLHWRVMSTQPAVLLVPAHEATIIVVPDFFVGVVDGCAYADDVRLIDEPQRTDHVRDLPFAIADIVRQLGLAEGRIALEGGRLGNMAIPRPLNDIDAFRGALSTATFLDGADVIWKCRVIKSACEVEVIREATQAIVNAFYDLGRLFQLGMTERDVSQILRSRILEQIEDCDSPYLEASSRLVPMPDTAALFSGPPIPAGDRLVLEPLGVHKGYYGSCCRVLNIGEMTQACERKAVLVDAAQEAAIDAIRPGLRAKEIVDVINDVLTGGGLAFPGDGQAGHSIGLTGHEPPMITRGEEALIEEGMVLAVETWVTGGQVGYGEGLEPSDLFGCEDLVVVTAEGCDPLPFLPRPLRCLPFSPPRNSWSQR